MRYDKRTRQVLDFISVTHNPDIRDLKKKAGPGEMEITPEWVLASPKSDSPILKYVLSDFTEYLQVSQGIKIGTVKTKERNKQPRIELEVLKNKTNEDYETGVTQNGIKIKGGEKGLMRVSRDLWLEMKESMEEILNRWTLVKMVEQQRSKKADGQSLLYNI